MPQPWPPPPDLASIQELLRAADPEGHIAQGAPADEYSLEEEELYFALRHMPTADLITTNILPPLESIWRNAFSLNDDDLAQRRPVLTALAGQIARFFGPEAQPQTRQRNERGASISES